MFPNGVLHPSPLFYDHQQLLTYAQLLGPYIGELYNQQIPLGLLLQRGIQGDFVAHRCLTLSLAVNATTSNSLTSRFLVTAPGDYSTSRASGQASSPTLLFPHNPRGEKSVHGQRLHKAPNFGSVSVTYSSFRRRPESIKRVNRASTWTPAYAGG